MSNPKKKVLKLEFGRDNIDLSMNISIKRKVAWLVIATTICIFILLASSLQEDIRDIILQALLWAIQNLLNGSHTSSR